MESGPTVPPESTMAAGCACERLHRAKRLADETPSNAPQYVTSRDGTPGQGHRIVARRRRLTGALSSPPNRRQSKPPNVVGRLGEGPETTPCQTPRGCRACVWKRRGRGLARVEKATSAARPARMHLLINVPSSRCQQPEHARPRARPAGAEGPPVACLLHARDESVRTGRFASASQSAVGVLGRAGLWRTLSETAPGQFVAPVA
ncbi:hypothetical protein ACCO45_006436 [Purpureocillium lilacinum]|uniref:Uncharacterized protein n=1 Tax=Purpureocillium lilacinum TaxID=33203 RepID=A0ACC4DRW2_PURLI